MFLPRVLRPLLATAVCAVLGAGASPALAGDWTIGEISATGVTRVAPRAVNIHGVVVGTARFPGRVEDTAFRWEDGSLIELAVPGGANYTVATDINDNGTIVGQSVFYPTDDDGTVLQGNAKPTGAVWTGTKTTSSVALTSFNHYLGTYTGDLRDNGSGISSVNNDGLMIGLAGNKVDRGAPWGISYTTPSSVTRGGAWSEAAGGSVPKVINDVGTVVSENGQLSKAGGAPYTTLTTLYPGPKGLNNLDHVVGRGAKVGNASSNFSGRLWNGSSYIDFGASQTKSMGHAINDAGTIVGRAFTDDWQGAFAGQAWMWQENAATPGTYTGTALYTLAPSGWAVFNATDINADGMIVATGTHGGKSVGLWMAPANLAHKLSGTVHDGAGNPKAGAKVVVRTPAGDAVATLTTDAAGKYETTQNRGPYVVSVEGGNYLPNGLAGCTIEAGACRLYLSANRVVDFFSTDIVLPVDPGSNPNGGGGDGTGGAGGGGTGGGAGTSGGGAGASGGGASGGSGAGGAAGPPGPPISLPKGGSTATPDAKGGVSFKIGPAGAGVSGSLSIRTNAKYKVGKGASRQIDLGKKSFSFKSVQKNGTVKLSLSKDGKSLLKGKGSVKATLTLTLVGPDGGTSTVTRVVTIRSPKKP